MALATALAAGVKKQRQPRGPRSHGGAGSAAISQDGARRTSEWLSTRAVRGGRSRSSEDTDMGGCLTCQEVIDAVILGTSAIRVTSPRRRQPFFPEPAHRRLSGSVFRCPLVRSGQGRRSLRSDDGGDRLFGEACLIAQPSIAVIPRRRPRPDQRGFLLRRVRVAYRTRQVSTSSIPMTSTVAVCPGGHFGRAASAVEALVPIKPAATTAAAMTRLTFMCFRLSQRGWAALDQP